MTCRYQSRHHAQSPYALVMAREGDKSVVVQDHTARSAKSDWNGRIVDIVGPICPSQEPTARLAIAACGICHLFCQTWNMFGTDCRDIGSLKQWMSIGCLVISGSMGVSKVLKSRK